MSQFTEEEIQKMLAAGIIDETRAAELRATTAAGDDSTIVSGHDNTVATNGGVAVGRDVNGDVIGKGGTKIENHGKPAPNADTLKQAYLNHVLTVSSQLSLAGVDPKATGVKTETQLNLGAVYTALLTVTPELRERLWQDDMAKINEERRLSALAQLNQHQYLVLLGNPGSGKSTFVNFVAMCLAGEALAHPSINKNLLTAPLPNDDGKDEDSRQPWTQKTLLPIRVILRDFTARGLPPVGQSATASHLWKFIVTELDDAELGDCADVLHHILREEGGLLLLDGLDEVPEADERRTQIKQAVENFVVGFPKCRVLVTSRTYAYQNQAWKIQNFSEAVLVTFSAGQIRRFVDHWYAHIATLRSLNRDDAQGRAVQLKHAIFSNQRLLALAERPLLLTLMASLHAWRGGSLPEKREELYADAVELLLDNWESPKTVRDHRGKIVVQQQSLTEWLNVDRDKMREQLNELAFEAHQSQPELLGTADIAEQSLVNRLLAINDNPDVRLKRLLEYLSDRAGLLVPRGVKVYTFPHRTFQEYLAACHLTDDDFPNKIAELARQTPNRWREVALLAGAKASRGTAAAVWLLADALCYRNVTEYPHSESDMWGALFAGQALLETMNTAQIHHERNREKLKRIKDWLVHILESDFPPIERAQAGDVLARLDDPRPGVGVRDGVPEMAFCYIPAGDFWMGSDEGIYDDESPQHLQRGLNYGYWLGKYAVTVGQWRAYVEAGHKPKDEDSLRDEANRPVRWLMWNEAVAYCRWLTEEWRKRGLIPENWVVRLPSAAEWEKGARGGVEIPVESVAQVIGRDKFRAETGVERITNLHPKRRYPWGSDIDANKVNYKETGIGTTSAVGAFPWGAGPYGCEDMSGNVYEWCSTKWQGKAYPFKVEDEWTAAYLAGDAPRVVRGGAFGNYQNYVRSAIRGWLNPSNRNGDLGFRVMLSPF